VAKAEPRRSKPAALLILAAALTPLALWLGWVITVRVIKGDRESVVEAPDGSRLKIDARGNVTVRLPEPKRSGSAVVKAKDRRSAKSAAPIPATDIEARSRATAAKA
jgi:ferric-dicitrate binding protein FerR (iron transport regulator)